MMTTRWIRALAALGTTGALLAGCAMGGAGGGGGDAEPTLSADAEVSGEITVWSWDVGAAALERLGAQFEKEHPGTTIEVVDVGYDNAYDKISVGLQAGSGLPDVVTIETDRAPGYIAEFPDGFVDLTPVFGDREDDFDPFKWGAQTDADGNLRMVPWDSGTVALYYRTDILAEAGVDPASIETWDDLLAAGEKVKKTGHTLLSTDIADGAGFQVYLQQQGQSTFDENGDVVVNSPAAVRALTFLQVMNQRGYLKNYRGWDGQVTSAKDGDSAFTVEAVWWIGTLTSEMPELAGKYGVRELPVFTEGDARTSNNGGSALAVPSQSENPELAAAFVEYALADVENQTSMMAKEGLFPSYLPALESDLFAEPVEYFGGAPVYTMFAEQTAEIPPVPRTTDDAKAGDILANAVAAAVLGGDDPQTVLDDAAQQIATATGRDVADPS